MFSSTTLESLFQETKKPNRCIVRLKTSIWSDSRGLHVKKSLNYLRRKSEGFNLLEEDIGAIGADYVYSNILNMDTVPDGCYELVTVNETHDFESGHIDGYDYELHPYTTEKDAA